MVDERRFVITQSTETPFSLPIALQEKYVVSIEVRANAATAIGEADHDVIKAPGGDKGNAVLELGHIWMKLICCLNQQCPDVIASKISRTKWAMLNAPRGIALIDQSALYEGFCSKRFYIVFAQRGTKSRESISDQKRSLLPVLPNELVSWDRELYIADAGADRIFLVRSAAMRARLSVG